MFTGIAHATGGSAALSVPMSVHYTVAAPSDGWAGWQCCTVAYLDLCVRTLDLTTELPTSTGSAGRALGADLVFQSCRFWDSIGKRPQVSIQWGTDALSLPLRDGRFDVCTVGSGTRSLADVLAAQTLLLPASSQQLAVRCPNI